MLPVDEFILAVKWAAEPKLRKARLWWVVANRFSSISNERRFVSKIRYDTLDTLADRCWINGDTLVKNMLPLDGVRLEEQLAKYLRSKVEDG